MKKFICTLSLVYALLSLQAQSSGSQQRAIVLKRLIERNHFNARAVNDSFSSLVFTSFMRSLDPQQDLFTLEDYNRLAQYRYKLDDELNGGQWAFLDLTSSIYLNALKRSDSIVTTILQKPLDFNGDEMITFSRESIAAFPTSVTELRNRWTKWFKFQLLDNVYDIQSLQSPKSPIKDVLIKNENALRQKLKKTTLKRIQSISENPEFKNYLRDIYLNSIATTFDPHTSYFSPDEKAEFESSLSTENNSFGFMVDDKEGKVIIQQLIPGGPAWKSGELHRNDQILELQFGEKEIFDVTTLTAEEVEDLLDATNHNSVSVKVRKTNSLVKSVQLKKEKIETEENIVKGYILKGEKTIGYISLPDFYTTWENESGSGCANDVAKEIIKLKKENIDGLIVDVRFNGGGSLSEALQLIGIFIDDGPVLGVKDKSGKLVFLKDPNRGTIYDGPMALMINGQSASASEVLAAALQDYNRAVIIGSPSYGKATMQAFFQMDTTLVTTSAPSPNGFVKITTGKLYRLTGNTAQLNGVLPDITLPDLFDQLEFKERFSANSLLADTVKKNAYYKPLVALPVNNLLQSSKQRTDNNKDFKEIQAAAKYYGESIKAKKRVIPLKPEAFERWMDQNKLTENSLDEKKGTPATLFTVTNHRQDIQRMQNNPYSSEINTLTLKNLQQDIYIEEAFQVITDLIKLKH